MYQYILYKDITTFKIVQKCNSIQEILLTIDTTEKLLTDIDHEIVLLDKQLLKLQSHYKNIELSWK